MHWFLSKCKQQPETHTMSLHCILATSLLEPAHSCVLSWKVVHYLRPVPFSSDPLKVSSKPPKQTFSAHAVTLDKVVSRALVIMC